MALLCIKNDLDFPLPFLLCLLFVITFSHLKLVFAPSSTDSGQFGYACILRKLGTRHGLYTIIRSFRICVQPEACSTCYRLSLHQTLTSWTNDPGSKSVRIETIRKVHDPDYRSLGTHRRIPPSELYPPSLPLPHCDTFRVPRLEQQDLYTVLNSHQTDPQTVNLTSHISNPPKSVPARASDRFHHRSNVLQQDTHAPPAV